MARRRKQTLAQRNAAITRRAKTDGTYETLLQKQGGTCALPSCEKTPETSAKNTNTLDVDHDHATGAIRGLLCRNHNLLLKRRISSAQLLREFADYLDGAGE